MFIRNPLSPFTVPPFVNPCSLIPWIFIPLSDSLLDLLCCFHISAQRSFFVFPSGLLLLDIYLLFFLFLQSPTPSFPDIRGSAVSPSSPCLLCLSVFLHLSLPLLAVLLLWSHCHGNFKRHSDSIHWTKEKSAVFNVLRQCLYLSLFIFMF